MRQYKPGRLSLLILAPFALLAACQQSNEPAQPEEQAVSMGPEAKPGLSLTEGKLVLNAVSGNPGAAYFTIVNNSEKAVTFVASHIEGAGRSEMHGPLGEHRTMLAIENLVIGPHSRMVFEPGKYHVMAFEIGADIVAGGNTEITLTSADGDKISAPLKIEAMGGMDHGSGH